MSSSETTKRRYDMSLRAEQSNATAIRIRHEAWKQFSSRPYDEVTLAEVGSAAGVTVRTVMTHFGRKEDLFLAAYKAWAREAVEQRERTDTSEPTASVRNLLSDYERDGGVGLHMLAEEERFPAVKEMTDLGRAYHRSWIKRIFQAHLGSLPAADRERRHGQLVVASDLLTWKLLRSDMGMSRPKAEATVLEMLATLTGGT